MELELGQMLWSGQDIQEYEAYWATDGLCAIGEVLASIDKEYEMIGANAGASFENDTFIMKDYCWCDNEREGHENGCPPNFVHKPSGLVITWYKHCGRGITANKSLGSLGWLEVVTDCLKSLKSE